MPCPRSTRVKLMGVERENDAGPPAPARAEGPGEDVSYLVSGFASPPAGAASATTVPCLLVQAFSDLACVQPLPLQPFWPLQSLSAPLQEPLPLQELMPAHFTPFAAALAGAFASWAWPTFATNIAA